MLRKLVFGEHPLRSSSRRKFFRPQPQTTTATLVLSVVLLASAFAPGAGAQTSCHLNSANGSIQHVIYVQFDNVHFTRDNPNVPSDLEQMPHLLNFLKSNGTLLTNHHTPLISHTADDIITSLTGVYPERHGQAVANSFGYFNPASATGSSFASSFTYWTDRVDPKTPSTDSTYNLLTAQGRNAPAPWVPFTRAGCNVGAISIAEMELENVGKDITTVFGPTSPEAAEAAANYSQAVADFEGIAVHCAAADPLCANGKPDVLPDEPEGYTGFNALFGNKYVAQSISPSAPLTDLNGVEITDGNGNAGFPGFGGISAAQSLGYVAAMQEKGVAVTYAYISDAHDDHTGFGAFGPGQAGYVAQLQAYDAAFGKFFTRLANDGITPENTLFIFTADEGDHFAGGPPSPANCDGVTVPCTYAKIGEIDTNIKSLLTKQDSNLANTTFDIHFDMAPAFYIQGQPAVGSPVLREFEQATSKLTAVNPITGNTDTLTRYLADPVEMKLLHMVTADALRTPSYVMFGDPDYYFQTYGPDVKVGPGYAWNHGGVAKEINTTFLGLVGPGVKTKGVDNSVWSDHTDIRPTLLNLVGLHDDYQSQGRTLAEVIHPSALPAGIAHSSEEFTELSRLYKQINAPVGTLGLTSLSLSTKALAGDDATYNNIEQQLTDITEFRNGLTARIANRLDNAEFHRKPISEGDERELTWESRILLEYTQYLNNSY